MRRVLRLAVFISVSVSCLFSQSTVPEQSRYKVTVTPGTPSIWSMEQAHYLLNRLRANNDAITTKVPSAEDLDANAVNGIRLNAKQTSLGVSAAFDQTIATQNKIALQQFDQSSSRHSESQKQADRMRAQLYQDQITLADLNGQAARLTAQKSILPADSPQRVDLDRTITDVTGRAKALTDKNEATAKYIQTLDAQAGTQPAGPTFGKPALPASEAEPPRLLNESVTRLLNNLTSGNTNPRIAASDVLNRFVGMQLEIVAKQLTALRDEVGKGQRIVFLEMPTSISSADTKDKLAQSWWRVRRLFQRYDKENR